MAIRPMEYGYLNLNFLREILFAQLIILDAFNNDKVKKALYFHNSYKFYAL